MPNWCSNYVTISHSDPAMIEKLMEASASESIAETFHPVPADLDKAEPGFLSNAEYDWRVVNWGTKWDFGIDNPNNFDGAVTGYFLSAWSPPIGVFNKLVELGFDVQAYWHECGMCFAGEFDNGDVMDYEHIEYTEEGLNKLPSEIVELFSMWDNMESEEESEETA